MPFSRPNLTDLRALVAQDIAAQLPGTDPLLRFSNLGILSRVLAGLSNLHYGYLDWIARQAIPATATDEYLEEWAALKGVTRAPATSASGTVTFVATAGSSVPTGTALTRSDGVACTVTSGATAGSGGTLTVSVEVNTDPTGLTGAFGNCTQGTQFTLTAPITGVQSTGTAATQFTGGADIESDASLRSRMLQAYQSVPAGGSLTDYERWSLSVPGVTRAWVVTGAMGPGTIGIYPMLDLAEAAYNGFPQGTNGVAASDPRGPAATGDQLTVANAIALLRPATDLVWVLALNQLVVDFTIAGIAGSSAATKDAISAAIAQAFVAAGAPNTTFPLTTIESAILAVPGTAGFVLQQPASNISIPSGWLPVVGTVSYV